MDTDNNIGAQKKERRKLILIIIIVVVFVVVRSTNNPTIIIICVLCRTKASLPLASNCSNLASSEFVSCRQVSLSHTSVELSVY